MKIKRPAIILGSIIGLMFGTITSLIIYDIYERRISIIAIVFYGLLGLGLGYLSEYLRNRSFFLRLFIILFLIILIILMTGITLLVMEDNIRPIHGL